MKPTHLQTSGRPAGQRDVEVTIDLGAIVRNLNIIRDHVGPTPVAATVKADAYGTGIARVAPALRDAGVDTFFVASIQEGVELRALLPDGARIFVFNGFQKADGEAVATHQLFPVLNTLLQIRAFSDFVRAGGSNKAAVHLDTGINRLGLDRDQVTALQQDPALLQGLDIQLWLSHLACADEPGHPLNERQRLRLIEAAAKLPPAPVCFANSAGCLLGKDYHFDLVRPGIALYGGNPTLSEPSLFENVATVSARILQLRRVAPGDSVGYGATFTPDTERRIAIVSIGYADGLFRALGKTGSIRIADHEVPFAGRVSMDLLALDVTRCPPDTVQEGEAIEIIGPGNPVDMLSRQADTIPYEILTALRPRSRWRYIAASKKP